MLGEIHWESAGSVRLKAWRPAPKVTWPPVRRSSSPRRVARRAASTGSTGRGTTLSFSATALRTFAGAFAELDRAAAELPAARHQHVAADQVVDDLAGQRPRHRNVVARPLRHRLVRVNELVVPEVLEQRGIPAISFVGACM